MKTLHQITIQSPITKNYWVNVILAKTEKDYVMLTLCNDDGIEKKYTEHFKDYRDALSSYIKEVQDFAKHTVLMNF